jgi:hypothetical protein
MSEQPMRLGGDQVAARGEGIGDRSMDGEEALGGIGGTETLHLALALSDRHMRALCPVVLALALGLCHGNRAGAWSAPSSGRTSRRCGRRVPPRHGLSPEGAQRAAGDQMTLEVECVVNDGVHREEALARRGRLEALHLSFAAPGRLVGDRGRIVLPQTLLVARREPQPELHLPEPARLTCRAPSGPSKHRVLRSTGPS